MINEKKIVSNKNLRNNFFLHFLSMRINFIKIIIISSVFDRSRLMIRIENSRNIKNFIHKNSSIKESQNVQYYRFLPFISILIK